MYISKKYTNFEDSTRARQHRHSLCHQMNNFKFHNKHIRSSSSFIFSTAVISGSSSAPNLSELVNTSQPAGNLITLFSLSLTLS